MRNGNQILLNQSRFAEAENENITVPVNLDNRKMMMPETSYNEDVSLYGVYLDERHACTKIRLSADINVLASNVIFNSVTEIVKNEGSNECKCLNFNPTNIETSYGKGKYEYKWGSNITDAVMDTQISYSGDELKNYTYLCGIDIYNNHILRAKTKFPSYIIEESSTDLHSFNTIGEFVSDCFGMKPFKYNTSFKTHKYTESNIMTFQESLLNNIKEKNGWIGFINKGQTDSYMGDGKCFGVGNVINNQSPNKFIELFPDSERYCIMPHYNKHRRRLEKNWEYCLVYPCTSQSSGFTFINSSIETLKIAMIDENEPDDDDVYRCVIYSVTKHGLVEGDTINLFRSRYDDESISEVVESNCVVNSVIDDYTFSVYTSDWVSDTYVSILDDEQLKERGVNSLGGGQYTVSVNTGSGAEYKIPVQEVNGYINCDVDTDDHIGSMNLSYAKTVNGIQSRYYVRIFSRYPNFDFYDGIVDDQTIYEPVGRDNAIPVDIYADMKYEKQSVMERLAFSRNVYGDEIGQIVYIDDIDISHIKDNLGRPLTSLYLMVFKTNYGYKDWYNGNISSESVEFSRCFGKLNCGIEMSPSIDQTKWAHGNVHYMNNVTTINCLDQSGFRTIGNIDNDEIVYSAQTRFYGDVCGYNSATCMEEVIQPICHRFNTAQRELTNRYLMSEKFKSVMFDEILDDDYGDSRIVLAEELLPEPEPVIEGENNSGTSRRAIGYDDPDEPSHGGDDNNDPHTNINENKKEIDRDTGIKTGNIKPVSSFSIMRSEYDSSPTYHPEGYYYKCIYEVPIRSFSDILRTFKPNLISISEIKTEDDEYIIKTPVETYFNNDSNLYLYDVSGNTSYMCELKNLLMGGIDDVNIIKVTIPEDVVVDVGNVENYKIYERNINIPSYAESNVDGLCDYRWRDIAQNGFETGNINIPEYPFTNGCLYVNTNITLALRRQDPFGEYGLSSEAIYYGLPSLGGIQNPVENGTQATVKDAIREEDIRC